MTETEKAPARAATLTGAVENGTMCKTAQPSTGNDTTSPAERQMRNLELLQRIKSNGRKTFLLWLPYCQDNQ